MTRRIITWLVVVSFVVNLGAGNLLRPALLQAYDAPPKDQGHDGSVMVSAGEGKPPWEVCVKRASPVSIRTGDYAYSHQDLFISGRGLPLQVTRTYNSQDSYDGPFGYGWKFNLEIRLAVASNGVQEVVTIRDGSGIRLEFTRNPDGSYQAPPGRLDQLKKNAGGSYTWSRNGCGSCAVPLYQFDASGYLAAIQDPNNNQQTLSYDAAGKLKQVMDAVGRSLKITYGTNNKISVITDAGNRTYTYTYDSAGNLKTYTDPAGNGTTYNYDAGHNLTSMVDSKGNTITTITYDAQDRAVGYTEFGGTWTYSYDPTNKTTYKYLPGSWYAWQYSYNNTGQVTTERDPYYNTNTYTYNDKIYLILFTDARQFGTSYEYDERGNRTGVTDPLGNKTTVTYHPSLNLVASITDSLGRTTSYDYDDHGNIVQVTDAEGNKTKRVYDGTGLMVSETNPLGYTTGYTYDINGYLKSVTDPLGNKTSFTHDILGNLTQMADPNGKATQYTYDALGNPISITNALGHKTTYGYDENSNRTSVTDAMGKTTTFEYDIYNRLVKVRDPLNQERVFAYDVLGDRVSETDANGYVTSDSFDLLHRLMKRTYPDGTAEQFAYDADGNMVSIKDPKGNTTTLSYDALSRLSQITYADGSKQSYFYDSVGNLINKTDQKGNSIQYVYNGLNRLTTRSYPDGTYTKYNYDKSNRLISAKNDNSEIKYSYNKANRINTYSQDAYVISYFYDKVGNLTKLVYPDKTYIKYAYDALRRISSISDSENKAIARFTYDKNSRRTKIKYGNLVEVDYVYNDVNNVLETIFTDTSASKVIDSYKYSYGKEGHKLSAQNYSDILSYKYDSKYQLIQSGNSDGNATNYNFDEAGNRKSVSNVNNSVYLSNNMNQYIAVGESTYGYDLNGNLVSDGNSTYDYNYNNNLIGVASSGRSVVYKYDALGRRISKLIENNETKYVYDAEGNIIQSSDTAKDVRQFVYGNGIDDVLSMFHKVNGKRYYYSKSDIRTILNITGPNGKVVEQYVYDTYGHPTIKNSSNMVLASSVLSNMFMFTGRVFDPDTGLYYYRAREYNPKIGRFHQLDPLGQYPGDVNLYRYARNDPVNYSDPYGLEPLSVTMILGILAALGMGIAVCKWAYGGLQSAKEGNLIGLSTNMLKYEKDGVIYWDATQKRYRLNDKDDVIRDLYGGQAKKIAAQIAEFEKASKQQGYEGLTNQEVLKKMKEKGIGGSITDAQ